VVVKKTAKNSKLSVKKQTVKDLDPKRKAGGVKGGGGGGGGGGNSNKPNTPRTECCPASTLC